MIKNIIFDLGGVLIDFYPENYLKHINLKEDEIQLFKKLIWGSKTWLKGDRGDLNYEQIIEEICKNNPIHSEKLRFALENKDNSFILSENPNSCLFFYELKQRGFKVYFLSNVNTIDLKYDKEAFEIFKSIDGAVYSAEVRCAKPEKECYEALLNKYNLVPEECIFIDDNLANIEMAKKLKINSVLFDNLESVKNEVENIINVNNKELANI